MRILSRFLVGSVVAALRPNASIRDRARQMQAPPSVGTHETLSTDSLAAHPLRGEASRSMRSTIIPFIRPGWPVVVMQRGWSYCLLALSCLFVVVPVPAHAQIVASGQTLTVTTANARATFQGPDLVGLTNAATGESYLKLAPSLPLMNLETMAGTGEPLTASEWTTSVQDGTTIASLTMHDSVRSVTIAVNVDATSQEIVIKLWGQATQAGVTSAYWVMAGLDLSAGRLIVPASTGIVFDREHPGWGASMGYPGSWHAQMLVYETSAGSMVLYSTDSQYLFKQLRIATRANPTVDLSIVTEAIGPWPSATSVPAVEWRLKAFPGDWRTAASVYRDWLVAHRPRVPNASDAWAQGIRTVATLWGMDSTLLDTLANLVTPSRTLIVLINWRQAGYDVNYPDYTPAPGVAALVAKAHALGFKVMLHTDIIGVSPTNPDYASVQSWQVRNPWSLELMGWQWNSPPSNPGRFAIVNPASSVYRRLFVERVGAAVTAVQPDALHLDFSGSAFNDGNGPIEGMSYPQGAVQLHKDLIAAFPNLALGGEGMTDVIYAHNSFAQIWFSGGSGAGVSGGPLGHPIANFLWNSTSGGQTRYYGQLTYAADPAFKSFVSQIERRGILPALVVGSASDLDLANPDNMRLLKWLQSWQTNGFQPDWTGSWSSVLIPYKAAPGSTATAALSDTGTLVSLDSGGTPIYQRAHDTVQQDTASYVLGWPAFDSTRIYGLDPTAQYWLDAVLRPSTTHISSLSPGVRLGADTMVSSSFALIQLAPTPTYDFVANLWAATIGTTHDGIDGPLPLGNLVMAKTTTAGGVTRQGIFMHPPDAQAGAGEETFAEWSLALPTPAVFTFSVGVDDAAGTCTDGVTFRVVVNGMQAWRQHVLHQGWIDGRVDLSAYAGTTIRLRIATQPGPANNWGCDWASFSALALSRLDPVTTSVPITLASGAMPSGLTGSGVLSVSGPGAVQVDGVSVPGEFTLFLAPGTAINGAPNLASLPFTTWLGYENELPTQVLNDSGSVSTTTAGGITKQNAIFAHPPNEGRTILNWVLAVPDSGGSLSWSAALADTAWCTSGVRFEVRVNGLTYWTLFQPARAGWSQGTLGLSAWRGTNILLQLVTDSVGDYNCDHAWWADLVVSPVTAPGIGTIVANPYGAIGVQGADLNGNVISNAQQNVVIQLGAMAGSAGSFAEVDFQGFNLGPDNTLTIKSGGAGQTVLIVDKSGTVSAIDGTLQTQGSDSIAAPQLYLENSNGVTLAATGKIVAPAGLTIDTLGATAAVGAQVLNEGILDGGNSLALLVGAAHGAGEFRGDDILLSTFGHANNPIHGAHFLDNGLRLYPSTGSDLALTLNAYGSTPQYLNVMLHGNAAVTMPSAWPAGSALPPNSPPVLPKEVRPAGTPEPSYGAGSIIVQAAGTLTLLGGERNDFVFPGGVVLKSGGTLDVNGVVIANGWTITGQSFQGVFFEAPNIVSSQGPIEVFTNALNWANFSTTPHAPVRAWQLVPTADGGAHYLPADTLAPHLNTYSILIEAAAAGQCWVCLVNNLPVDLYTGDPARHVASVAIEGATQALKEGDTLPLTAVAKDQDGAVIPNPTATWSISDPKLGAISDAGVLQAYYEGTLVVTATVNGVSGTQTFTITPMRVAVTVALDAKEVVFDYTTDRCHDLDVPDQPARFVRAEDGSLVLIEGNAPAVYLSRGADFNSLRRDCSQPTLVSADRIDPESYENQEWLWVVYREGSEWHALIHNEYHDPIASTCKPGDTSPANPCWYNSITHALSTDGGRSFSKPLAPAHVVAPPPDVWVPPLPGEIPPGCCFAEGYRTPTNVVRATDGYYYALMLEFPTKYSDARGLCVIRTNTLDDPASWRAWDGKGFNLRMTSPYVTGASAPICTFLDTPVGDMGTVVFDTYLRRYLLVSTGGWPTCGFFVSLSADMVHWSKPQLIVETNLPWCAANPQSPAVLEPVTVLYPSIVDHADTTVNFEVAGRTPYLYYVRFNDGGLDRDLVRVPLKFTRLD